MEMPPPRLQSRISDMETQLLRAELNVGLEEAFLHVVVLVLAVPTWRVRLQTDLTCTAAIYSSGAGRNGANVAVRIFHHLPAHLSRDMVIPPGARVFSPEPCAKNQLLPSSCILHSPSPLQKAAWRPRKQLAALCRKAGWGNGALPVLNVYFG